MFSAATNLYIYHTIMQNEALLILLILTIATFMAMIAILNCVNDWDEDINNYEGQD